MRSRGGTGWFMLGVALALIATLASGTEGYAQKKRPTPAEKAARQQLNFQEAEVLRQAYVLLAGANHTYGGHRVKAMKAIEEACLVLDVRVMKNGTPGQKAATVQEDLAAAAAKQAAQLAPAVHESRGASDGQLRQAGALLTQLRTVLAAKNQKVVLGHVDQAIHEISAGLKVP